MRKILFPTREDKIHIAGWRVDNDITDILNCEGYSKYANRTTGVL